MEAVKGMVWNNVQDAAGTIAAQRSRQWKGKVSVIEADKTVFTVGGEETTVGFVTDAQTGQIMGIDILAGKKGGFVGMLMPVSNA